MSKKTGNKYFTDKCGRCGCKHINYSGKLDKDNVEYVVCGNTNKRMNIVSSRVLDIMFLTIWIKENSHV